MAQALIQQMRDAAVVTDQHTSILVVRHFGTKEPYPCQVRHISPMPEKGVRCIYALIDPRDGKVFYIGQTVDMLNRMRSHCQVYRSNKHFGKNWLNKLKLEIADSGNEMVACVLATPNTQRESDHFEMLAIQEFKKTIRNTVTQKWQHVPLY